MYGMYVCMYVSFTHSQTDERLDQHTVADFCEEDIPLLFHIHQGVSYNMEIKCI